MKIGMIENAANRMKLGRIYRIPCTACLFFLLKMCPPNLSIEINPEAGYAGFRILIWQQPVRLVEA
jgi:hypothetical protein